MEKFTIYTELFARFIAMLVVLPFAVVFLILYAGGFLAEYFFTWIFSFSEKTKVIAASLDKTVKQ